MSDGVQADRFDRVTMSIHWITLALIAILFASAWMRGMAEGGEQAATLLFAHRSAGVLLWGLTVARLVWRYSWGRHPALPGTVPTVQRAAAGANAALLYILLLLQPLAGIAQSLLRGKPFELLFGTVPALIPRDRDLTHLFHDLHEQGAWLLLGLIALHALAALTHHFVLRDRVLLAMLPGRSRRRLAAPSDPLSDAA